ncbi:hypothetical protein HGRIS_007431 [Hohenbuehelia grisea]|uniref:ABC transporter n=1 Tax=Hohenbuehelia grisea TaxID=104357 RepID=A0ABR3J4S4_9AGAR
MEEDGQNPEAHYLKEGDQPSTNATTKLVAQEEIEIGHVRWAALKMYLGGLAGSYSFAFFVPYISGYLGTEILRALQTWFLGQWAEQYNTRAAHVVRITYYLGIYGLLVVANQSVYSISEILLLFGRLRASNSLHRQLIESVLSATFRWHDTTPTSRIIARCTQDIGAVDGAIPGLMNWLAGLTMMMLVRFVAVVMFAPGILFPGMLIALCGGWIGQVYIKAQLSVKREMTNAKSPVLGHIGSAIYGLTSIRAYGAQSDFKKACSTHIDHYSRTAITFYNLNRWISIRIDFLGSLFSASLAAYLVYFGHHSASNTGLSLNMAAALGNMILWWVQGLNAFEIASNSLERIYGYLHVEREPQPTERGKPPAYWPTSGEIHVQGLSARYSPDGPKVLHDISFNIRAGQRVGVVGRTGAGKSSLVLALLRCIPTEGEVLYDGISTSSINLEALRSSITVIPQVPELLNGSIRQNLDPFSAHDDADLNNALEAAGLFSLQAESQEGKLSLETQISSGGSNLSVGQRQILALARAVVRRSKVLILDEATSAIDHQTDKAIQASLKAILGPDVTLIMIAHRLKTVKDADKIMVLDSGSIVEFGSPKELLEVRNGRFRAMVDESGDGKHYA